MPLEADGPLGWWSPDPRGVLPLEGLRVTGSLRKSCRRFTITVDTAFVEVMLACGNPRRPDGWITPDVVEAYAELHRLGWAHSVETRTGEGDLVGGLYGVEIGGLFAGESMFSTATDASKVALVALVERLAADVDTLAGRRLLDVQWRTEHLASLGVVDVDRLDYLRLLESALALPAVF
jgi:leucyl/phenylalanyl-tRNA--protein transferase